MLKYFVAEYLRDKENLEAVVEIIRECYSSCIHFGNEEDKVRTELEKLGELEVLNAFENGKFSWVT